MGIDIFIPDCLLGLGYFYIKRRRMTKQEIICMAQEAQMPFYWRTGEITYLDKLERFAALVASAEREAIYDLVMEAPFKEFDRQEEEFDGEAANAMKAMAFSLTSAIRARGQA